MMSRRAVGAVTAALLLLLAVSTTGCVPEPEPSPTPAGFATEEEAFAAAEETYRAYVDAVNGVDLSNPETFEAVYAWTADDANAAARESFSQMHADGWTVAGATAFDTFVPLIHDPEPSVTTAQLCLDVSNVTVVDRDGASVVSEDRLDRQPIEVTFVQAETPTRLQIAKSGAIESELCAG
ncbi:MULTISPECIES: hypothetical protein [unclassified Microbacterium]|uniref:hypothetical protein n=1 Tax=unclassified Microbacterium TaxID=2609290 RepID=UPI00214CDE60|nr:MULTISPECIES: hypothetical protein [unclassified Microbacterium]MCR2785840.1 hypothetical protein [Microbacterium sp. zg.B96]WIM17181.1 hypothetical protein QNO11_05975 [Microbacterium sp. zg-B96]